MLQYTYDLRRRTIQARAQEEKDRAVEYCKKLGYRVTAVFRDTKTYLVEGKPVDPTGNRFDRPCFQSLVEAGEKREYDVIVVDRMDQLYRGLNRSLVAISELEAGGLKWKPCGISTRMIWKGLWPGLRWRRFTPMWADQFGSSVDFAPFSPNTEPTERCHIITGSLRSSQWNRQHRSHRIF